MTLTIIEHSERFDRPNSKLRRDAKSFRLLGDIVVRTEMSPSARQDILRAPHWSVNHGEESGVNETAVEWANETVSLDGMPYAVPLTEKTYFRTSGAEAPLVHALVTPCREAGKPKNRLVVISVHMSLDNTPRRAEVWRQSAAGLKRLIKAVREADPGVEVIVIGDINKNIRKASERAMIEKHICAPNGLALSWDGFIPDVGGTHGGRQGVAQPIIDMAFVSEGIEVLDCYLLPDTDGSDHRPWAVKARFRKRVILPVTSK